MHDDDQFTLLRLIKSRVRNFVCAKRNVRENITSRQLHYGTRRRRNRFRVQSRVAYDYKRKEILRLKLRFGTILPRKLNIGGVSGTGSLASMANFLIYVHPNLR